MYATKVPAQSLIDNDKVDVNIQYNHANSALHVAIDQYNTTHMDNVVYGKTIQSVISRKDFDKDIRNNDGNTCLYLPNKANCKSIKR